MCTPTRTPEQSSEKRWKDRFTCYPDDGLLVMLFKRLFFVPSLIWRQLFFARLERINYEIAAHLIVTRLQGTAEDAKHFAIDCYKMSMTVLAAMAYVFLRLVPNRPPVSMCDSFLLVVVCLLIIGRIMELLVLLMLLHSDRKYFPRSYFRTVINSLWQGQRTLNGFDTKDLHQEVIIPATDSTFHGEAVFAGMLFEQRQSEAPEPCQIFRDRTLASS